MFYAGMGGESEGTIMRNYNPNDDPPVFDGFLRKVVANTLPQLNKIYDYLGAIVAAPLFFLSLLHPFKRPEIAHLRWCILLMWMFAAIGMSLFGIEDGLYDSNQLNILFIPLMTGYGLAFLSVLWARLSLPVQIPMIRNGHLIFAVLISAAPLLFTLPWAIRSGITIGSESQLKRNYPYFPDIFYSAVKGVDKETGIVASDAPWAIAWYTDRVCVWLPKTETQFEEIAKITEDRKAPIKRIIFTPLATHARFGSEILNGPWGAYKEEILYGTESIWNKGDTFIRNRFGSPVSVGTGAVTIYSTDALP